MNGKTPHTPRFGPFWAYSCTPRRGVELFDSPLVKSLFCPINTSPNEVSGPDLPNPPHLNPNFSPFLREKWGGGGGGVKMSKKRPPFFGSKIMNRRFFFSVLSGKTVFGSRLHGVCMGWSGTSTYAVYAVFSHFCNIGDFGNLGDPVVPTLRGARML